MMHNITTTVLINVLSGGLECNPQQAVYAQRVGGKFRAESPAFLGNRALENRIHTQTSCEFFAASEHILAFFAEFFGEDLGSVEYADLQRAAKLLIDQINRGTYLEYSTTTLANILAGGLIDDDTQAIYALRLDGRFSPESPALLGHLANMHYIYTRTGYEFFATSKEVVAHYTECFGNPASAGYTALRQAAQALVQRVNENLSAAD
jgi:hypothetical protein